MKLSHPLTLIINPEINLMFAGFDLDIEQELNRRWQQNEELSDYREDERRMRDEEVSFGEYEPENYEEEIEE